MISLKKTLSAITSKFSALNTLLNDVPHRTLLWTNPNTTYSTGKVSLSLSDYDEIEILCAAWQTSGYFYSRCPVGKDGLMQFISYSTDSTGSVQNFINTAMRKYSVATSGVTFQNGQMLYAGSIYQNWSNRAVPLKIYGIKFGGGGYKALRSLFAKEVAVC